MEAVRIIKEMREEDARRLSISGATVDMGLLRPRFAIWENVPGAFSSNNGEDFRVVLEELAHIRQKTATIPRPNGKWGGSGVVFGNDWSIAWRQMDAQYWGVPQRRKRIALVMDLGGKHAANILFESKGLQGNTEQSIEAWEGIARNPEECVGRSSTDDSYTLKIRGGSDTYIDQQSGKVKGAGKGALIQHDESGTLGVSQDQTLFS